MGTSASMPADLRVELVAAPVQFLDLGVQVRVVVVTDVEDLQPFDQVQPEVVGLVGGGVRQVGEEPVEMLDDEHRAVRVVAAVVAADDEGLDGGVRPALIAPALQHPFDLLRRRSGLHRDSVDVVNHDLLLVPNVVIIPNRVNYGARHAARSRR